MWTSGVLADALDMASDAAAYAVALAAVGRSLLFKRRAAQATGGIMVLLGIGVLVEVVRRALYGSEPMSVAMLFAAALSLLVNLVVLKILLPFRSGEVHLRATWICTRADVMANLGVLAAAALVAWTGSRFPDLVIGALIGIYVLRESWEILRQTAKEAEIPGNAGSEWVS
ncbi:MAG: cation transporter [Acidobacteria bacterium]|nr:cation transporter [Acidobacteriota bacterium]